jgi:hypothetical protein
LSVKGHRGVEYVDAYEHRWKREFRRNACIPKYDSTFLQYLTRNTLQDRSTLSVTVDMGTFREVDKLGQMTPFAKDMLDSRICRIELATWSNEIQHKHVVRQRSREPSMNSLLVEVVGATSINDVIRLFLQAEPAIEVIHHAANGLKD